MQQFTKTILAGVFAGLTVAGVAGVSGCAQSETRRSTGQTIDDASITARVKTALVQAPDVSSTDIDVSTNHGVVQLSGFADSSAEAERAVTAAQSVAGVRSVKNDIRVKPRS